MAVDDPKRIIELIVQKARWLKAIKKKPSELSVAMLLGFLDDNGDLQQFADEDGLQVTQRDFEYEDAMGTPGSASAVYTPTCTMEIVAILADMIADATVDDRDFTVALNRTLRASGTATVIVSWRSQAVSVQAGEYGMIWLPNNRSGYYYVSDNGSRSASTVLDNPVPFICRTDNTIAAQYTNAKAADNAHLRIWYRKISNA